jgi:hypothetical protein
MLPAMTAIFFELKTFRGGLFVLRIRIVPVFTFLALERDDFARHKFSLQNSGQTFARLPSRSIE